MLCLLYSSSGEDTDPKKVLLQSSNHPIGPWSKVAEKEFDKSSSVQKMEKFDAPKSRYWRLVFLSNHGEMDPMSPRFVFYEVQFWGPDGLFDV